MTVMVTREDSSTVYIIYSDNVQSRKTTLLIGKINQIVVLTIKADYMGVNLKRDHCYFMRAGEFR